MVNKLNMSNIFQCHKAKNLVPETGGQATRTGEAVLEIQVRFHLSSSKYFKVELSYHPSLPLLQICFSRQSSHRLVLYTALQQVHLNHGTWDIWLGLDFGGLTQISPIFKLFWVYKISFDPSI
jgi:hypothetical protein